MMVARTGTPGAEAEEGGIGAGDEAEAAMGTILTSMRSMKGNRRNQPAPQTKSGRKRKNGKMLPKCNTLMTSNERLMRIHVTFVHFTNQQIVRH